MLRNLLTEPSYYELNGASDGEGLSTDQFIHETGIIIPDNSLMSSSHKLRTEWSRGAEPFPDNHTIPVSPREEVLFKVIK